jgi:hypothetical protein
LAQFLLFIPQHKKRGNNSMNPKFPFSEEGLYFISKP